MSSMGGVNRAVFSAQRTLESRGTEVVAFHAVGTGGRAMEETIEQGLIDGVLDLVTHEVTDTCWALLRWRTLEIGGSRREGIPQVVVPGCVDFIAFSPPDRVPGEMRGRPVFFHTPEVAIVRTNASEMTAVGRRWRRS